MRVERNERGIVLAVVLFFTLLLASTVLTFQKKSTLERLIIRNRDATAHAEALARGGFRLATALLYEDAIRGGPEGTDSSQELWYQASGREIPLGEGESVRLQIEDAGTRLNLNACFQFDESGAPHANASPFLEAVLEKVIDEIPVPPGEKVYDVPELAAALIDWVDADDLRQRGGPESGWYQQQIPPYASADRPLLSVDELRRVRGFDAKLVDALRSYVTVYPFAATTGINPNTAPPHVLSLLYYDDGVSLRLAEEDVVREILRARQEEDGLVCGEEQSGEGCVPMSEIVRNANTLYPPPSWSSDIFTITSEARVGEVRRRVEAVVDRRQADPPLLLSWRVQ